MGQITQRISQFRGINRSTQQNGLDVSYAYNAENVDISGGVLSSKVGSYRLATDYDVIPARPIPYFTNAVDYLILRQKFIKLTDRTMPSGNEIGGYEPATSTMHPLQDVVWDWDDELHSTQLLIRGVGRSFVRARVNDVDTVICSGMLDKYKVGDQYISRRDAELNDIDTYWTYRDFFVDGATGKTCVYYLGEDSPEPLIHCREFGSGPYLLKDRAISAVDTDSDGHVVALTLYMNYSDLTEKQKARAELDGIYLFHEQIGATMDEDDLDNAFMWLKVTSINASGGGNAVIHVDSTRLGSEITTGNEGDYVLIRGECSDAVVTFLEMYYGRLFAATHRANVKHPRRLYWSCLPGDGRSIEDWTSTEASIDTSGGHVDIGDPSDGYITGLVVSGSQMLIFTQTRLWRLYGTAPSNYRIELIGNLEGTRISNPVEVNGTVYWLSRAGITYYNGSYVTLMDDNCSTRRLLDSLPEYMLNSMYYSSVHANLFDGNIMFAIDATAHRSNRESPYDFDKDYNECYIIRYNLETGDVIKYVIPCSRYRQQFTDVLSKNFGVVNGNDVNYETRYFQSIVQKAKWTIDPETQTPYKEIPETMVMTQWKQFGMQTHGWYDNNPVKSAWETDWNDLRSPETTKRIHTTIMRGSGEFDLSFESEINRGKCHVCMPENRSRVYEATIPYAEGRSMKMVIESDKQFEIEPYMTMLFEAGGKR